MFARDAGIDLIQGFCFYKPTHPAMVGYERSLHPEMNLYADIRTDQGITKTGKAGTSSRFYLSLLFSFFSLTIAPKPISMRPRL